MVFRLAAHDGSRGNSRLGHVTHKALTQALRRLERNGLVTRRVIATSPVAVEYSITPLGLTLQQPFAALYAWAVSHMSEVEQAQTAFDHRTSSQGPFMAAS